MGKKKIHINKKSAQYGNRDFLGQMPDAGVGASRDTFSETCGNIARRRFLYYKRVQIELISILICIILIICSGCGENGYENSGEKNIYSCEGELVAYFLDVGQADSTLLVSDGEAMLIDAGNCDDSDFLVEYIGQLGIKTLKYIVFTHPHEDHIGSGEALIDNFGVEKIYMLDEYDEGLEGSLKHKIREKNIKTEMPEPGDRTYIGGCSVEFLGPVQDYSDTNDDSICLKINHGSNSMVFTGDAGSGPERDMIDAGFDLEADLLQMGHHGSSASGSYYFLREVNPRYAVISCGADNMYGHPHEETLSRLSDLGAEVFRTDEQGTVVAVDDGKNITFNCDGKKAEKPYTADEEKAKYIGNLNSKKYHVSTCGGLPEEQNRIYFMSIEKAEDAGYEPCGRCHPDTR